MTPTVTNYETFHSLLVTCTLKGTLFLLGAGVLALLSSSASQRHFTWLCSFLCLGALLILEPLVPHWAILPGLPDSAWLDRGHAWALPLWSLGALLFCGKVTLGLLALGRIERASTTLDRAPWDALLEECRRDLGIRRPIRLLQFPGRIMPMTWGVLRPFVVLPSSAVRWSAQRVRAVLMHELAHVRRADYLVSLMRDAVCVFYWFHPLVWWAVREMDDDREQASDDAVLAAGERAVTYAEHLASVATRRRGSGFQNPQIRPRVALAERPLLVRIRAILNPWKSRHPISWPQRLQTAALLIGLLAVVLTLAPTPPASSSLNVANRPVTLGAPAHFYQTLIPGEIVAPISESFSPSPLLSVSGWAPQEANWKLTGTPLPSLSPSLNRPASNASLDALRPHQPPLSGNAPELLAADDASLAANAAIAAGKSSRGAIYVPPAEYSTSPPDETEEGPAAIDIGEVMASFENVGHIGMDDFDLGHLTQPPAPPSTGAGNGGGSAFLLPEGSFFTASLDLPKTGQPLKDAPVDKGNATVKSPIQAHPSNSGLRPGTEKALRPQPLLPIAAQNRPDPGLETRVGLVKSRLTGASHLAITFRRKASAPTASFRFEASPDLTPGSWDFNPDLFVFAGVQSINGQHEATIVLSQPMPLSPFRFLRIRSTSAHAAGPVANGVGAALPSGLEGVTK